MPNTFLCACIFVFYLRLYNVLGCLIRIINDDADNNNGNYRLCYLLYCRYGMVYLPHISFIKTCVRNYVSRFYIDVTNHLRGNQWLKWSCEAGGVI